MKFLAAIDLTKAGHGWLAEQALAFAFAYGGTVDLLFVGDDPDGSAKLHALLHQGPEEVRGQALVQDGNPLDRIVAACASYDALVMGPQAHGALERFVLGTMAARVIRAAPCAVYVPRSPPERARPQRPRILVGVDMSGKNPGWIVGKAGVWAQRVNGRLDAVFANPHGVPHIKDATIREAAKQQWHKGQEPTRQRLETALEATSHAHRGRAKVVDGEPESVLVDMSDQYDLILLGTRERTGLAGYLLGSVAEHVVQNSACDVLTLPSNALDTA